MRCAGFLGGKYHCKSAWVGYDKGMAGFRTKLGVLSVLTTVSLCARDYGPPIGARMPAVRLQDQDGKARALKSLLGPKGAVILVFRSADW